jgi:hypothetical protein
MSQDKTKCSSCDDNIENDNECMNCYLLFCESCIKYDKDWISYCSTCLKDDMTTEEEDHLECVDCNVRNSSVRFYSDANKIICDDCIE